VIDAATGDYLPSGTYNTNLVITNETVNGKQMQEVWQILGLDPNAPLTINEDGSISVGNITINAVTTGVTPNRSTTQTRT
jgi:alpha-D-ribose 1-methylphosphonate 5-triphosphate diphosphatase PhnM